jgi:hypothetical protein
MSSKYSPNAPASVNATIPSDGSWSSDFIQNEKQVFNNNIPLVISTSLTAAVYSYFGIDGSTNNAINRALLMALSTFVSASVSNMLQNNGYIDPKSMNGTYVEAALIPLSYYAITKRQFQLPDVNSQALKTGIISSVVGSLANPTVTKYYTNWEKPASKPTTQSA